MRNVSTLVASFPIYKRQLLNFETRQVSVPAWCLRAMFRLFRTQGLVVIYDTFSINMMPRKLQFWEYIKNEIVQDLYSPYSNGKENLLDVVLFTTLNTDITRINNCLFFRTFHWIIYLNLFTTATNILR